MSAGEKTREKCRDIARKQADALGLHFYEIADISPSFEALKQVFSKCPTEYVLQLDADMILKPNALATILEFIWPLKNRQNCSDSWKNSQQEFDVETQKALNIWYGKIPKLPRKKFTHASFVLWDEFEQGRICSLKVWHAAINLEFMICDCSPDEAMNIYALMIKKGYLTILDFVTVDFYPELALHGTQYTPAQTYVKYRDRGRKDFSRNRLDQLPEKSLKRLMRFCLLYEKTSNQNYISAILGYVAGIDPVYALKNMTSKNNQQEYNDEWVAVMAKLNKSVNHATLRRSAVYSDFQTKLRKAKPVRLDCSRIYQKIADSQSKYLQSGNTVWIDEILAYIFGSYAAVVKRNQQQADRLSQKIACVLQQFHF